MALSTGLQQAPVSFIIKMQQCYKKSYGIFEWNGMLEVLCDRYSTIIMCKQALKHPGMLYTQHATGTLCWNVRHTTLMCWERHTEMLDTP